MTFPIAVLVSGTGSNLQAILDTVHGTEGIEVACVGANKPSAPALERARAVGVETGVFEKGEYGSREERDLALGDWLEAHEVELVVLAGFMEILSAPFIRRFQGHSDAVKAVVFSPDGQAALSGSDDTRLGVWDIDTGEPIRFLSGHGGGVKAIAFNPDGRTVLSGSADATLRLWDLNNGAEIHRFTGHSDRVRSVAFVGASWLKRLTASVTCWGWTSRAGWDSASQLPEGTACIRRVTIACGSSSSGIRCNTLISMTATGWLKSSSRAACANTLPVSRRSAST